jgi:hypothetical protein
VNQYEPEDGMGMMHASDREYNATIPRVKSGDESKRTDANVSAQQTLLAPRCGHSNHGSMTSLASTDTRGEVGTQVYLRVR